MNLPNKITLSRILLLPVFLAVGLIDFPYHNFVAIVLFILLAVSDFLDGFIARKYNMVTNLGKFLDPIADKLLCTTGQLLLIVGASPIIPDPYGIICIFIILLRDYAITGFRQIAQLKGVIIPADKLGKIKANCQYIMVVFGFLIAGLNAIEGISLEFMKYFKIVFYVFVGFTTAIVFVSGVMYIAKNRSVLKDDDSQNSKPNSTNTANSTNSKNTTNITKTTKQEKVEEVKK